MKKQSKLKKTLSGFVFCFFLENKKKQYAGNLLGERAALKKKGKNFLQ